MNRPLRVQRWRRWGRLAGPLVALVVLACGEPVERAGTNTNWLRQCATDADCGPELHCDCGRCSIPCAVAAECANFAGVCASPAAAALQCRDGAAPALCLAPCSAEARCPVGQLCRDGACVDALVPEDCAASLEALACDDFEGTLGGGTSVVTDGNELVLVSGVAPSGSGTLEATVTLDSASVAYLRADFAPQTTGTLYLRAWFEVLPGATTFNLAPFGLWASGDVAWALRLVVTQGATELWSYTTPAASAEPVAVGEWHCVELVVALDDVAGTVDVGIDGAETLAATALDTLPDGGVDGLVMGTVWAAEAAAIRVDRVALTTSPLGCWD